MTEPKPDIPFKSPVTLTLEPGTYWFWASHRTSCAVMAPPKQTGCVVCSPLAFTIDREKTVPYCDNAHLALE